MVVVGYKPYRRKVVARVCVVDDKGRVVMDRYVRPDEPVTMYKTGWSGICAHHLEDAPGFAEVQAEVIALLNGHILVGHCLHFDLKVLQLHHDPDLVRDTGCYPPLMLTQAPTWRALPRSLRSLASEYLGLTIQTGAHSPVDDARAAMSLYQLHQKEWESCLSSGTMHLLEAPLKV
ncbi:hypothetical protein WJX73_005497 [Symbiochloris irregularis]|uniref:Exonuclease domain-containing protein n=1 Tax=Symbiochloris irregularis TaxID=706552 RepID=A0AAW1Q3E4_9CHLO